MKILLYYHTGCKNHGCEAIVKTICQMFSKDEIILYSFDTKSDMEFGLSEYVTLKEFLPKKKRYSLIDRVKIRLHLYQEGQECFTQMLNEKGIEWAFAIGGDSYCYKGQPEELAYINREFHKCNIKTALFGCSINEDIVSKKNIQKDLNRYNIIIARESLTYGYMKKVNIDHAYQFPDTAFALPIKENADILSSFDDTKKYIGINLSPLIAKGERKSGIIYRNYENLIRNILDTSEYNILLIPHVFVDWDNDSFILNKLFNQFRDSDRIFLVKEAECSVLKWYVSKCSFVVCARTHVSIAAYSLGIPTLVVGYSVKSEGIAKDLFDTYKNYVLSAGSIETEEHLLHAFEWLVENAEPIKSGLVSKSQLFKEQLAELPNLFN